MKQQAILISILYKILIKEKLRKKYRVLYTLLKHYYTITYNRDFEKLINTYTCPFCLKHLGTKPKLISHLYRVHKAEINQLFLNITDIYIKHLSDKKRVDNHTIIEAIKTHLQR